MEIYVQISLFSIYSPFFLVFNHYLVTHIDFTHVAASNTASDTERSRIVSL